jgi:lysophospholipase L1-like esterase
MKYTETRNKILSIGRRILFAGLFVSGIMNMVAASFSETPFDTARIYNAMAKARRGEPVTIGVIGGSITAGSLASTEAKRWANIVTSWWRTRFPLSSVTLVNAGIGATGSDIGTFRIQKNILQKDPDFVIVEFAVNDAGEDSHYVQEMMEGVVRQLLTDTSKTGVMLLLLKMENGATAQADHKVVGDYYKIPWVSQADQIDSVVEKDGLTLSQVYGDTPNGVHPNDIGMQYIADFIIQRLDSIYAHLPADEALPEISMNLPEPLVSDVYAQTYTFTASTLIPSVNTGWSGKTSLWSADTPGAELVFRLDGNAIAVQYDKVFTNNRGRAEVWTDDGPHTVIDAFFTETWGTKPCFQLVAEGLSDGEHYLHIKILEDHDPLSNGNFVQILSVYKAGNITSAPPIAVPGNQKKALVNHAVLIDGTPSYDPDNDTITAFHWTMESAPAGSAASVEYSTSAVASFTPDLTGNYSIGLVVDANMQESVKQICRIHAVAANAVPVADAGADITLATGKRALPDGTNSSDADGDVLSYTWTFLSKPAGSKVSIMSGNTATPSFIAKDQGEYLLALVVNDSLADSPADTVKITAIDGYTAQPDLKPDEQKLLIYPNPTGGSITLQYYLSSPMQVRIRLFSPEGRLLCEPLNEIQENGLHVLNLNADSYSVEGNAIIIQVETGNEVFRQKVVLY